MRPTNTFFDVPSALFHRQDWREKDFLDLNGANTPNVALCHTRSGNVAVPVSWLTSVQCFVTNSFWHLNLNEDAQCGDKHWPFDSCCEQNCHCWKKNRSAGKVSSDWTSDIVALIVISRFSMGTADSVPRAICSQWHIDLLKIIDQLSLLTVLLVHQKPTMTGIKGQWDEMFCGKGTRH